MKEISAVLSNSQFNYTETEKGTNLKKLKKTCPKCHDASNSVYRNRSVISDIVETLTFGLFKYYGCKKCLWHGYMISGLRTHPRLIFFLYGLLAAGAIYMIYLLFREGF